MSPDDRAGAFERLAEQAGIEPVYRDYFGNETVVSDETKRALLHAFGFSAGTDAEALTAVQAADEAPWRRAFEPVTVALEYDPLHVALTLPSDRHEETLHWHVDAEDESAFDGTVRFGTLPLAGVRTVDGRTYERRMLHLPQAPAPGYHRLRVEGVGETRLILAPRACYLPAQAERGERLWSLAVQLYSLRSDRDWGCGDFGDLRRLAFVAVQAGAAALGLNPLHELDPANPAAASPYSPSSRLHLNVAYIDVEAVPEFLVSEEAQARVRSPEYAIRLARLRAAPLVDYAGVAACKRPILEALFIAFARHHLAADTERAREFLTFVAAGGTPLARLAAYEALREHFVAGGTHAPGRLGWPTAFADARASGVAAFVAEHRDRIEFFAYLQWVADSQLRDASQACADMAVGLYRDLAVGAEQSGAETWSDPDVLAADAALGAPPDPLNGLGQQWGLAPFNPLALRERAYEPFVRLIRANMRHAGALRIDHVMGLQRLFLIPAGKAPKDGAYVRYPLADLFAIVALESQRNACMVIGEDLGTVPEGFRERMHATNVLSCRVLYFERETDGTVARPERYPIPAIVSPGTHDLPTFAAFWTAADLALRAGLGLLQPGLSLAQAEEQRARERASFLDAFAGAGVLDATLAWHLHAAGAAPSSDELRDLVAAAYRYLAQTKAILLSVSLEDVLGVREQVNVPGTVSEHANWQTKLTVSIDDLACDARFQAVVHALAERRQHPLIAQEPQA